MLLQGKTLLEYVQSLFNDPVTSFLLVFIMGFIGSSVNAFAGGGAFLTFATLLSAGLPPIIANATSKIAFIPGSIAAAWAYRHSFKAIKNVILSMLMIALIGGTVGGLLTLYIGNKNFQSFIPWLILGSTVLVWRGDYVIKRLQENTYSYINKSVPILGHILLIFSSLYGGFFGAGLGVLLIATLNFKGITDIHAINAIKNIMSVLINLAAVIMYIIWGMVDWNFALIQMLGAILGGYTGGLIGRSLNPWIVRMMITGVGLFLSAVYFYQYGYLEF